MSVPLLVGPATFAFVPTPDRTAQDLAPGEVLVRVRAAGICGSDLPFFRGAPVPPYAGGGATPPGYPMHEIAGDLLAVGPGTPPPAALGSPVVGWATRFDGLADVVVTEATSVAPYPPDWPAETAVLAQPLACVLYAVERLGDVRGRRCAVLGLGPIGLLFAHCLKQRGATVVGIDRVDRSDVAAQFGVDELRWSTGESWAASVAEMDAPDVVVEAVGHQVATLRDAITAVAPCGTVFAFGVNDDPVYPLDMSLMLRKHLTLMSGGTLDRSRMLRAAMDSLQRHPELFRLSITHTLDRADVQQAFTLAATPAAGRLKVVLTTARDAR